MLVSLTLAICLCMLTGTALCAEVIHAFAGASLTHALQDVGKAFTEKNGCEVRFSFAASSTLARQIEQGAPADVYLSANPMWMDYLEARGLVEGATRVDLLGNALVVVCPKGEAVHIEPRRGFDFSGTFKGRLAVADPSHVPAGIYAKQALQWLGWWDGVADRLARGQTVRAALVYVERRACPVGVVYATDAEVSSLVRVVARIPREACGPIVYPGAVIKGHGQAAARQFMDYLQSAEAAEIFQRAGFLPLIPSDPK